uniref:Uncharacterized protein n=1 Tax=Pithovirus LCPAC304 TaxID=2506594 RepID=A0A481Z7Q9_9VIRU|nr:MAG: hypothetical protein LCPAC304_02550 [Pithovirus LCPAC304]
MMFLVLLVCVLVLVILIGSTFYAFFHVSQSPRSLPKNELIHEKGKELKEFVSIVINHIQLENAFHSTESSSTDGYTFLLPSYHIVPSETITYTNDKTVHLLFWNYHQDQLYDDNTLRCVLLHEIAIFLAKGEEGVLEEVKEKLLDTAIRLHYIDV